MSVYFYVETAFLHTESPASAGLSVCRKAFGPYSAKGPLCTRGDCAAGNGYSPGLGGKGEMFHPPGYGFAAANQAFPLAQFSPARRIRARTAVLASVNSEEQVVQPRILGFSIWAISSSSWECRCMLFSRT